MKPALYNRFSTYLKDRFGERVQKVTVDGGFSCPNRDGTKGEGGCIYCDNEGFTLATYLPGHSIGEQIAGGIERATQAKKANKFMVYFQSYSNTYAPVAVLREKYEAIREFDSVVSLAIGTRPDCVNESILELINSYTDAYEVWIEYGLQSAHDKTLHTINRGHTVSDFVRAVEMTRKFPKIKMCAHVIFGLPDETESEMLASIQTLADIGIDGIKFHPLHAVKGTELAQMYTKGEWGPLSFEKYVTLVGTSLAQLPRETVVQRLTADCPPDLLVAPEWLRDKNKVLAAIEAYLRDQSLWQGKCSAV